MSLGACPRSRGSRRAGGMSWRRPRSAVAWPPRALALSSALSAVATSVLVTALPFLPSSTPLSVNTALGMFSLTWLTRTRSKSPEGSAFPGPARFGALGFAFAGNSPHGSFSPADRVTLQVSAKTSSLPASGHPRLDGVPAPGICHLSSYCPNCIGFRRTASS